MKLNEDTVVASQRLLLVPYDAHHVPTYHVWMSDPAIQEATASEPLTLEEEYENQISWRTSGDKLTFILCLRNTTTTNTTTTTTSTHHGVTRGAGSPCKAGIVDTPNRMIGDINLFLTPCEDEEDEEEDDNGSDETTNHSTVKNSKRTCINGEIDIMIASPERRKLGHGREAVSTLLAYIRRHVDDIMAEYAAFTQASSGTNSGSTGGAGHEPMLKDLVAKINASNEGSIALFQKLGFRQRGEVNYFGEVLLVLEDFCAHRINEKEEHTVAKDFEELHWDRTGL